MAEPAHEAPRRRNRANWVALRTVRQRPKVVGKTCSGEPIVEIRSVRLVLREGFPYFNRMVTCSKCEREFPGAAVLTPNDLDHRPNPMICHECVRAALAPALGRDPRLVEAVAEGPGAEGVHPRLAALERRISELAELVSTQRESTPALEGRVRATETEVRSLAVAAKDLVRAQEDLDRTVNEVRERLAPVGGTDAGDVQVLEARMNRTVERLGERVEDQRSELTADLEARVAQLRAVLDDQARRAGSQLDEVKRLAGELGRGQEDLRQRLEGVGRVADAADGHGLEALEERVSKRTGAAITRIETLELGLQQLDGRLEGWGTDAARVEAQLSERLDRHAERAARAGSDGSRPEAVERQVEEAVGRMAAAVEEQGIELRAGLEELASVRKAVAGLQRDSGTRLRDLEEADSQRAAQLAELAALQAVLDSGLGHLRSGLVQVRESATRAEDLGRGLEALIDVPPIPAMEPVRGWLGGRKSAEVVAGLSAAVERLVREQRELKVQMAAVQNESETAARASARASAQAAGVHSLRKDVRALGDEVAALSGMFPAVDAQD